MKVLHLITGLGSGGAERMLVRIVLSEQRKEDSVRQIVVSMMDEGFHGETLRTAGVELHCLACKRGVLSLSAFGRLVRILRDARPDVVMTWLYHADLAGTLAAAFAGMGMRRLVWNLRCSNMNLSWTTRAVVAVLAQLSRLPGAVSFNSNAGYRHHLGMGYRPKEWVYLPNGFDLREWRPDAEDRERVRSELGIGAAETVVGMIARVDPMKDYPTFLAAAEHIATSSRDIRFVLIGKDTENLSGSAALRARMIALGERRDVSRLLRAFDIAVLPSVGEGFSNILGEAMATGVPCVATDVGDSAAIIGDTGRVVSVRSPDQLVKAILDIAAEPPADRDQRRKLARARIERLYGLESISGQYRALWARLARLGTR